MQTAVKLITAPPVEPVLVADAKAQMNVTFTDDDVLITALIIAAREQAETFLGRKLITQTWEQYFDMFPTSAFQPGVGSISYSNQRMFIRTLFTPLQSVTSITYVDNTNTVQTLDPTAYTVDAVSEPARIWPAYGKYWPPTLLVPNAVTVRAIFGYGDDGTKVPETIKLAIKMLVAHFYESREAATELKVDDLKWFTRLLWSHRVWEL